MKERRERELPLIGRRSKPSSWFTAFQVWPCVRPALSAAGCPQHVHDQHGSSRLTGSPAAAARLRPPALRNRVARSRRRRGPARSRSALDPHVSERGRLRRLLAAVHDHAATGMLEHIPGLGRGQAALTSTQIAASSPQANSVSRADGRAAEPRHRSPRPMPSAASAAAVRRTPRRSAMRGGGALERDGVPVRRHPQAALGQEPGRRYARLPAPRARQDQLTAAGSKRWPRDVGLSVACR